MTLAAAAIAAINQLPGTLAAIILAAAKIAATNFAAVRIALASVTLIDMNLAAINFWSYLQPHTPSIL